MNSWVGDDWTEYGKILVRTDSVEYEQISSKTDSAEYR